MLVLLALLAASTGFPQDPVSPADPAAPLGMCPVLPDEPAEPEYFVDHEGRRIFLCCKKCVTEFRRDPGAFVGDLAALGQPLPPTPTAASAPQAPAAEPSTAPDQSQATQVAAAKPAQPAPVAPPSEVRGLRRLLRWLGTWHPALVHFPIALALAAALANLLALSRANYTLCARYCGWGAALGALAAAPLGWAHAEFVRFSAETAPVLVQHRWGGLICAIVLLAAALAGECALRKGGRWTTVQRALLLAGAGQVVLVGYWGSILTYGVDMHAW
jgi:uncharacterized membrane protein